MLSLKIETFSPNFSVIIVKKDITYIKYWERNNLFKVRQNEVLTALTDFVRLMTRKYA